MFEGTNLMILIGIGAFIFGMLVAFLIVWMKAPSIMMLEDKSPLSFEEAVEALKKQAEELDWLVPHQHNVASELEKLGAGKTPRAVVVEICKPDLSIEILKRDESRIVVSLMPCRIGVYETSDGSVIISRMNTGLMSKMFGSLVAKIMGKASSDSEKIINAALKR